MASFAFLINLNESLNFELVMSTQTAVLDKECTFFNRPLQTPALVVFEPLPKIAVTAAAAAATDQHGEREGQRREQSACANKERPRAYEGCADQFGRAQQDAQQDVQRRTEGLALSQSFRSSSRLPTGYLHDSALSLQTDATGVTPTAPSAHFENMLRFQTQELESAAGQGEADRKPTARKDSCNLAQATVTVRLFEVDKSDLTTHIDLDFALTWPDSDPQKPEHSAQACLRLHARNCVPGSLRFTQLQKHNVPDALRTLPAGTIGVGKGVACISVDYTAASVWATNILGHSDFGPYHNHTMNHLRSVAAHGARIHMVFPNAQTILRHGEDFCRHFANEVKTDPLLRFWHIDHGWLEYLANEAKKDPLLWFWRGDNKWLEFDAEEVASQNLDYERVPPLFPSFRDLDDFSTKAMVPLVRDREYHTKLRNSVKYRQRARFVHVPHHTNRLIMLVEQDAKDLLPLQDDITVTVRIHQLNLSDTREEDWVGTVEPPPFYARSNDQAFTIHRRRNKLERQWLGGEPSLLGDLIEMKDLEEAAPAQRLVDSVRPYAVDIRVVVDTKSFYRREKTIEATRDLIFRERSANPYGVSITEDIILGNRFDRVPNLDMLEHVTSEQLSNLRAQLNPAQYPVLEALRSMPGGFALIHGAAGTGKSTSVLMVAAHCGNLISPNGVAPMESNLKTDIQPGGDTVEANIELENAAASRRPALRMLLTSPLNDNVEQNAITIRNYFLKAGITNSIVICEYSKSTTEALLTTFHPDARDTDEDARQDNDGDAALAELVASIPEVEPGDYHGPRAMLVAYNARQKRPFRPDKRVTPNGMKYSVAAHAIRVAELENNYQSEIPDEQVTRLRAMIPTYQIAALKEAYLKFKAAYSTITDVPVTAEERIDLTEAFQAVRESILKSADAVSVTCQLACDRNLWLSFRPKIFFLDEATRVTFAESLCFVWYPGCRFRIFAGDLVQPHAQCRSGPDVNPLVADMLLSFASRLHLGGFCNTQLIDD